MAEAPTSITAWLLIALALSPPACAIALMILWGFILPASIPRAEIERLANDIMGRYPDDPEEAAFIEEQAAWFRSQMHEQMRWRRVRRQIRASLR